MNLSKYFTLAELTYSSTAAAEHIANQPDAAATAALGALCTAVLDPLREAVGRPITISSGYRGPVLNQRVGGVADSQHLLGMAVDIQSAGTPVLALFQKLIAMGLPFDQIIYEAKDANPKWVHVSHRSGNNRGDMRVAQFGANGKPTGYPAVTAAQALAMTEPVRRSARAAPATGQPGVAVEAAGEAADVPYQAPAAKRNATKKVPVEKAAAKKAASKKAAAKKAPTKKVGARKIAAKAMPA